MSIVLEIAFGISLFVVSVLYLISLYERLSSEEHINGGLFLLSYVKEVLSLFVIVLTWVFGFIALEGFIPRRKTGKSVPVFLIPGFMLTRSSMFFLFLMLRNRGFENLFLLDSFPLLSRVEEVSERLAKSIKEICEITGKSEVILVGYSTGGIVARCIAQRDEEFGIRVRRCVTLGTPNHGARIFYLVPFGDSVKQIRPRSPFILQLNSLEREYTSIVGEYDEVVIRPEKGDVVVKGAGHFSILFSPYVADLITNLATEQPEQT